MIKELITFGDLPPRIESESAVERMKRDREAISKEIGELRKEGYIINSKPYKLIE